MTEWAIASIQFLDRFYGQMHLSLAAIALVVTYRTFHYWRIAFSYLLIMLISYVILHFGFNGGEGMGASWYLYCSAFEAAIVYTMFRYDHPAARYIAIMSWLAILSHIYAAMSWVDYYSFIDFKHANKFIIRCVECGQVLSIYIYALPRYRHLDKNSQSDKEDAVWQALIPEWL